jgi:hypothetical protein
MNGRFRIPNLNLRAITPQDRDNERRIRFRNQPRIRPGLRVIQDRDQQDLRNSGLLPPGFEEANNPDRMDLRNSGLLPPGFDEGGNGLNFPDLNRDIGLGLAPIPAIDLQNAPGRIPEGLQPIPGISGPNRNSSDKKRKITVSQNNLDPLSKYNFSRKKYGDRNGVRYNGLESSNIRVYPRGEVDDPSPSVTWSLAPIGDLANPPDRTSIYSLSQFVASINPNVFLPTNYYRTLFNQGNPYVYVEKPLMGSQEQYFSMPSEMLGAMFNTAESVLDSLSLFTLGGGLTPFQESLNRIAVRYINERRPNPIQAAIEDPEVRVYFDILERTGTGAAFLEGDYSQEVFDFRQQIRDRVLQNESDITLLDIVTEMLNNIVQDQISRDNEKRLVRYLVSSALININIENPLLALASTNIFPYTHRYVEFDTPYITNRNTYEYLNEQSQADFQAKVESDYNFFTQDYEFAAQEYDETLLPNIYAVNRYAELKYDLDRTPDKQFKLDELTTYLSLGNPNLDISPSDSRSREQFYNMYGKELNNITDSIAQTWTSKNSSIILENEELRGGRRLPSRAPMSIGLQFSRDESSSFDPLLRSQDQASIIEDPRDTMFENISQANLFTNRSLALYSTEYLQNVEGLITEEESPYIETSLRRMTFPDLITPIYVPGSDERLASNSEFSSLVIGNSDETLDPDDLGILEEIVNNKAESLSRESYIGILSSKDIKSSALGYRISKKKNNLEIQNFYIGNGNGQRTTTYVDSQIKYGDEYAYELYEYRLMYGTDYRFDVLGVNIPTWLLQYYLGITRAPTSAQLSSSPNISFNCWTMTTPNYDVLEIPIYTSEFEEDTVGSLFSNLENNNLGSIVYPLAKVLDYPPTAPILSIFPLVGNNSQIKINANPQTGESLGSQAEEIVSIGDLSEQISILKDYQDNFKNIFLPPNRLEYKNEGVTEIRNILLYRTTELNLDVENYNDLYDSFDPNTNPEVLVRSYSDNEIFIEPEDIPVLSYDILEDIEPNINYYYTCIVQDVHNNPSNPAIIYRVRLLLDKGLLIPEIDIVRPKKVKRQVSQKSFTRYVKIEASNIQTFPFTENSPNNTGGVGSQRSIGSSLGKSIEDQDYILRFTSKDTGRKFDLKLNFVIRKNGIPINT